MKRKQKRVTLLLASLLVGGFLVTGCTNSDYDFNEIDATMGFGGDGLELPASSTMDIPLKDVLDLEENGSVKLDDEGNYLFQLTGSGSSEANPKIEPIRLEGRSYNANIPISLSASAKATRSLTASSVIPEVKEKMFEYHGVDKSVKSLTKANHETCYDEVDLRLLWYFLRYLQNQESHAYPARLSQSEKGGARWK